MPDERATGIAVRRGAARGGRSADPRGTASTLWGGLATVMFAMILASVGMTSRRAEAQLVVDTGTTTISTGTSVSGITVATNASDLATLTMSNGILSSSGQNYIGKSGTGTFNLAGGQTNITSALVATRIGYNAGSNGTMNILSGTLRSTNGLIVGDAGNGTLNVSGGVLQNNTGNNTIGASAGGNGAAMVTSGTWNNAGNLVVGSSGTGTLTMSGGLVIVNANLTSGSAGTINLNSGGSLQIGRGNNSGVLLGGTGALTNNGTLIFNRSDASTYSGVLSGSGAVVKQGAGMLTLSGSNSYSGGTTLTGGTITLGNANALGTGSLAVNGGTLDLQARSVTVAALSGASGAIITSSTAGAVTLTGSSASNSIFAGSIQSVSGTVALEKRGAGTLTLSGSNSYTGGTTLTAGTLALGNADAIGSSGTISFGGGVLQATASNTTDYSSRFSNTASQQVKIDTNGQSVTLASNLTSSGGSFEKLGTGALTLSGSNSYSGGTTVSAGTLFVNGRLSNSAVTVGNGGTLGGSGTLGALVTVQSGGVLSPGNSPGALAAAVLDLQAGSRTFMEVVGSGTAGTDYDQIRVTTPSSLTYGGDLVLTFISSPLFENGTMFSLFSFTGTAAGSFNTLTTASGSSSYSGMTFQHNANGNWYTPDTSRGQYLVFDPASGRLSIVPEPSTWVLACLGAAAIGLKARRRRRVA